MSQKGLPRYDTRKKHAIHLVFLLDEEVTPQLFAQKIAHACKGGTLRPGEAICVPGSEIAIVVTDETLSLPVFGGYEPLSLPMFGYETHRAVGAHTSIRVKRARR
jgi:hypothetical protein